MVRVGVIGCGKIAQVRHLPEYEANSNAQITAVFDMNYDRACEIAKTYGAVAYKTLEELLASDVDAVSVCTANANHAASAIAALRAGKHVLCEKPMAITIDECEQMVAEARAAGKKLMIDQNQRFARAHVRAKELLDAGKIGDVLTFRTTFGHGGPETWSVDPGTAAGSLTLSAPRWVPWQIWAFTRPTSSNGCSAEPVSIHGTGSRARRS